MKLRKLNRDEQIKVTSLSLAGTLAIGILDMSYRFKKINYDPNLKPVIYAVWHGWQYGLLSIRGSCRKDMHLLVSPSNDGEIIGRISTAIGYSLIRGSQGRGGTEALRTIIKTLRSGKNLAYTVDGPRGPIHKVKEGIIKIAQMSQSPIVPLVPAARWKTHAKSWDQYQIPLLLTKAVAAFGDPIYVPKDINDEEIEQYRLGLENKLFELKDQAEILVGNKK